MCRPLGGLVPSLVPSTVLILGEKGQDQKLKDIVGRIGSLWSAWDTRDPVWAQAWLGGRALPAVAALGHPQPWGRGDGSKKPRLQGVLVRTGEALRNRGALCGCRFVWSEALTSESCSERRYRRGRGVRSISDSGVAGAKVLSLSLLRWVM